jgi:hypothetical protein
VLGSCKIDGKWCLAVRQARTEDGYHEGDPSCPFTNELPHTDPVSLLRCSRDLRLEALKVMLKFVAALDRRVRAHVMEINRVADSLAGE